MKVNIVDLKAQYRNIKKEIDEALKKILNKQSFILGEELTMFEAAMAARCGAAHAIGVASGTDALILALRALGIGRSDEVITAPHTFIATAEAVVQAGAKPVFVDIDPRSYTINPDAIERAVTKSTKAILPVHLYGQCADMDPILRIAKKYNLRVVEDCAQAVQASYNGKRAGSLGDIAAFSFFPAKNLGGFGDGGMVVTDNSELAKKVRLLRAHGSAARYVHDIIGYNSRLDTIQAAILLVKLKYLDQWLNARREHAQYYNERLKDVPLIIPYEPLYNKHTYHLYIVRVPKEPQTFSKFLNDRGVENRAYYSIPLHLQSCFRYLGYKKGDFPEAESAGVETFALPVYPELTNDQMDYVVGTIREFYIGHRSKATLNVRV